MAEHVDELLDHDYDGIRELDNNLPRWWLWLFYLTIVYSVFYMLYYHVTGIGYSQAEQYLAEVDPTFVRISSADSRVLGVLPEYRSPWFAPRPEQTPYRALFASGDVKPYVELTPETDTTQYVALTEPERLAAGQVIYTRNCAQCHGARGEGGIGPNLTDDYWLHGGTFSAITKSVIYGWPSQGMIAWRGQLSPDQILEVASFVQSLRGTSPPNPKPPQGELIVQ